MPPGAQIRHNTQQLPGHGQTSECLWSECYYFNLIVKELFVFQGFFTGQMTNVQTNTAALRETPAIRGSLQTFKK